MGGAPWGVTPRGGRGPARGRNSPIAAGKPSVEREVDGQPGVPRRYGAGCTLGTDRLFGDLDAAAVVAGDGAQPRLVALGARPEGLEPPTHSLEGCRSI